MAVVFPTAMQWDLYDLFVLMMEKVFKIMPLMDGFQGI